MNRILFQSAEVRPGDLLRTDGPRARHVLRVLRAQVGQTLRIGIVDGPVGSAELVAVDGETISLRPDWGPTPPRSRLDLLLALPRPKVLHRLWAPLASMGLEQIVITNAAKVERNYFDTHWLTPAYYVKELMEGLQQAGDTQMPRVAIERRFKPFVEDRLDALCPGSRRIAAHPRAAHTFRDLTPCHDRRLLLAIGPEGGWTDFELDLLQAHGFEPVAMGERTLRSDTACIALLALARNLMGAM